MTLTDLLKRRAELLDEAHRTDRWAATFREHGMALTDDAARRFAYRGELQRVEREIAKLKERK